MMSPTEEANALLQVASTLPDDSGYALEMIQIAGLREVGWDLAEAIQATKRIDARHARYQAHIWRERLENDGSLGPWTNELLH